MNEIQIFNSTEFGEVRTIIIDGKPWFVGRDIAKALGYAKPEGAVITHCKHPLKQGIPHPQSKDKTIEALVIPEGDMYRLISKSKLKSAERFEEWVFDEVLPQIRQTGSYGTLKLPDNPMELLELHYEAIKHVDKRVDSLEERFNRLEDDMPIFNADAKDIQDAVRKRAIDILGGKDSNAYRDKSTRSYVFADIQCMLRRNFGVKRYDEIKHKRASDAIRLVREHKPLLIIQDKVDMANRQMRMDL